MHFICKMQSDNEMRKNCFGLLFLCSRCIFDRTILLIIAIRIKKHYYMVYIYSKQSSFNISIANARRNERNWAQNEALHFIFRYLVPFCSFFPQLSFCARRLREYRFQSFFFPLFYFIYELFLLFGSSFLPSFVFFFYSPSLSLSVVSFPILFFCIYHSLAFW